MKPAIQLPTFALALLATCVIAAETVLSSAGRVDDFSLPTVDGGSFDYSIGNSEDFTVLCFLGTECPLARIYGPRLQAMADRFADDGVQFVGINSNVQDSMDEVRRYATEHQIRFPIAKDYDRSVALDAGATRTPEVIVVNRAGMIRYRGRIDDQYEPGITRSDATRHDLRDAIESLVDGKPVARPITTAVGCLIALPRKAMSDKTADEKDKVDASVTYCGQISRILQTHCVQCHRSGEIGPFALDEYDEVVGWADMSIEVIDQGRMPPWHASDEHAAIANSRHMPDADKQMFREWIDAGMPYGDASDLPPPLDHVDGWQLPQPPDLIFPMSETPFQIPADETVEYQYYVVDTGFDSDRWVKAAEVVPGNRAAVHHAIAFIRPPDGSDFRQIGLLSAYVPGQRARTLPEGFAQRIPAGSRIVFQMHYTPTGKPESDITKIGIVFADDADVTHEVVTLGGIQQQFEIPPGAANHVVRGEVGYFPSGGLLLSIIPHMHLRGKSFRFDVVRDDQRETLLEVPDYDFNWQHNYELLNPVPLDDVDQLAFEAVFDNSPGNPTNPDPAEYVTWGDQTWQEMAVTFLAVAKPRKTASMPTIVARRPIGDGARRAKAKKFAERYMQRFDGNGDAVIAPEELPNSVRIFAMSDLDVDGDGWLTLEEVEWEAYEKFD